MATTTKTKTSSADPTDPTPLVEEHIDVALALHGHLLEAIQRMLANSHPTFWGQGFITIATRANVAPLAKSLAEARLRGLMWGADHSADEMRLSEHEVKALTRVLRLKAPKPKGPRTRVRDRASGVIRPWIQVIGEFLERGSITRPLWDRIEERERREVFTVAYQSTRNFVEKIQEQVARGLGLGKSAREMAPIIAEAGEEISVAHAETVYRNNVRGAYSRGRAAQMTQPHVVALRPLWQVFAVRDSRTRDTHAAVHGWLMRADDPGWQVAYPPFGHNCRCRVVARSEAWAEKSGAGVQSGALPGLPDDGWTTTPPPLVAL